MLITVTVKTKSSQSKVERVTDHSFKVWTNVAPVDGQANAAITALLADFLDLPKSAITLVKGQKSKVKVFSIP